MIRSIAITVSAVALVAGCQQDKPQWSGKGPAPVEAMGSTRAPSGDVDARLARVEKKLDKITGFLKQAVRPELDTKPTYAIPVNTHDPIIGPKDAKVTVIEAYEFLCPYCNQVAPMMAELHAAYPNDVRFVPKYLLIHGEEAAPSGLGVCAAAKQGKAKEMEAALWTAIWPTPQAADRTKATGEAVTALAGTLGMDTGKFKADLEGADCRGWLEQSAETLQNFGTTGTPSFYVNGRVAQARSVAQFKKIIDEELAKADAAIAGGIKPADFYDKVVVGKGEPAAKMISPFDD